MIKNLTTILLALLVLGGCDSLKYEYTLDCYFPKPGMNLPLEQEYYHVNLTDNYIVRTYKVYGKSMSEVMVNKSFILQDKIDRGDIVKIENVEITEKFISYDFDEERIIHVKTNNNDMHKWERQETGKRELCNMVSGIRVYRDYKKRNVLKRNMSLSKSIEERKKE